MICSCCGKQKNELHHKKSRLMANMPLYLCNSCIEAKFEPRFVIILVGRTPGGADLVAPYIKHHRYHGDPILAKELVG